MLYIFAAKLPTHIFFIKSTFINFYLLRFSAVRGACGSASRKTTFFPCRRNGLFPFYLGATLHIQVTIIMVRCVFCHLGDFLSNWVAWPLCLSLNYSLDLLCSFLTCIFSVILQFAFKLCGYGGSIFPTHHSLMFPGHHFTLSSILKVFTLLNEDYSRKHIFIVFKKYSPNL